MICLHKMTRRPGKRRIQIARRCVFCGRIVKPRPRPCGDLGDIAFLGFVALVGCKGCLNRMEKAGFLPLIKSCGALLTVCVIALIMFVTIRYEETVCIWGPIFILVLIISLVGVSEWRLHYRFVRRTKRS